MKPHKTESWYRENRVTGPDKKSMKEIEEEIKSRDKQSEEKRRRLLNE